MESVLCIVKHRFTSLRECFSFCYCYEYILALYFDVSAFHTFAMRKRCWNVFVRKVVNIELCSSWYTCVWSDVLLPQGQHSPNNV